jgi:hypothetical protein
LDQAVYTLRLNGATYQLPVRLSKELPRGVVGLPVGLPGLAVSGLPAYGQLTVADAGGRGPQGSGAA